MSKPSGPSMRDDDDDLSAQQVILGVSAISILLGVAFVAIKPNGIGWLLIAVGIPGVLATTARFWAPGLREAMSQVQEARRERAARLAEIAASRPPIDARSGDRPSSVDAPRGRTGPPAPSSSDADAVLLVVRPSAFRQMPITVCFWWFTLVVVSIIAFVGRESGAVIAIFGAVAAVAAFRLMLIYLACWATTLIVTGKRTTLRQGILSRYTREVRHKDVREIRVDQSFGQRLWGFGTLMVSTASQGTMEIQIGGIPDPQGVAATLRQLQD